MMAGLGSKNFIVPARCLAQQLGTLKSTSTSLCMPRRIVRCQAAFISSKIMRDKFKVERPAPFPYKENKYGKLACIFDSTTKRFDDNTKLIVVEGNVGAGKTTFAKTLAEQLDMLYVPEATTDLAYVNPYGYDLRDYAHLMPESVRPFDLADYYKNPNHKMVANFQFLMYRLRYFQYVDALAHILNTGQGIVLERCAFSDSIFVDTMAKFGYLSRQAKSLYYEVKKNTITELMRPHLIVYLDVPVNILNERIKRRGVECEVSTSVLTNDYLQNIEDLYKQSYLKEIEKHAELLIYDWSDFGDVEEVVEDIERIDFDSYGKHDEKMKDWRLWNDSDWSKKRYLFTSSRQFLSTLFTVPIYSCPEVMMETEDMQEFWRVYRDVVPGNKYQIGYNSEVGDTGVLFKMKMPRIAK